MTHCTNGSGAWAGISLWCLDLILAHWQWLQNRTQLFYLWENIIGLSPTLRDFVLLFCNNDWLIFNCCWTKRISEASQSQKARSGQFWLGSNNFLLHPDHKTSQREAPAHYSTRGRQWDASLQPFMDVRAPRVPWYCCYLRWFLIFMVRAIVQISIFRKIFSSD